MTCEVAPHHFLLIDENVGEYDTHFQNESATCGPCRTARTMLAGLIAGWHDRLSSPPTTLRHAAHEKKQEFERAPMGLTGLETALGLCLRELHAAMRMGMFSPRILQLLTANPARVIGGPLQARGSLRQGSPADVTVFDARKKWRFDAKQSKSEVAQHTIRRLGDAGESSVHNRRWRSRVWARPDQFRNRLSKECTEWKSRSEQLPAFFRICNLPHLDIPEKVLALAASLLSGKSTNRRKTGRKALFRTTCAIETRDATLSLSRPPD